MDFSKIDRLKTTIDKIRPFEGDMLAQLQAYFRIGLTYSSNALEGNTLTISETKVLLEDGLTVGGKPLRDTYEAIGHAKAYDFMFTLLRKNEITEQDILTMHKLFYHEIDAKQAGKYRTRPVFITGSAHAVCPPADIQKEMTALVKWIKEECKNLHPAQFAAELHLRFIFIHPFIDGNGRVARLLMNTALIQAGYTIAIIPPVLRAEYIRLLERARTDAGPFMEFIVSQVFETQKEIIKLLGIKP